MLDASVPAHLTYNLHHEKDIANAEIYYGTVPSIHKTYEIRPAEIADASTEARRYMGGAPSVHTHYEVYPGTVQDAVTEARRYVASVGSIHTTYEIAQK